MNSFNLISFMASCIGWLVILSIALRVYKRQVEKPKRWYVLLFILGGLLSFSFNMVLWGELVSFAILPLGVWILYAFLRRKEGRWKLYRPYAWLGFWGNYIFLVTTLLALPIQDTLTLDERHVVVPFITNKDEYWLSYWEWKRNKWTVLAADTGNEPKLWKIDKNDPSSYWFVWNFRPENDATSLSFYLLNQRRYGQTNGEEYYYPQVQLE